MGPELQHLAIAPVMTLKHDKILNYKGEIIVDLGALHAMCAFYYILSLC